MRPFSTSRIDTLLEGLDAEPVDGIDEQFVRPRTQFEIGGGDILDHVRHLPVGYRGPDQRAEFGVFVGFAAERDLIKLLAVLLDTQNADVPDVMVPARVDAAGDID